MPVVRPVDRWFIEEVLPYEQSLLMRASRLCNGADEARDLVQDVFARMLAMEAWSAIANPRSYMQRMMRNIVIDRQRRANVIEFRHLVEADADSIADETPDQHRLVEDREAIEQLRHALDLLPDRCRDAFVRRRIKDQPPRQIAQELGVSLSTLEKRLARAVQLLTQALHPFGEPGAVREPAVEKSETRRSK